MEVIPNGVDVRYYDGPNRDNAAETMVFCASMDYFANQDAVLHFAKNILPRVREKRPQARFLVLGRSPPANIWGLANGHIAISGTVDNVRPLLLSAAVSVVPLRVAGGSRLKILNPLPPAFPSYRLPSGPRDSACGTAPSC